MQNTPNITPSTLKIAWISDFPIEWLAELPEELRGLPRRHPLTWQRVLLGELQRRPELELHVVAVRRGIRASVSFARQGVVYHVLKAPAKSGAPTLYWVDTFLIRRALRQLRPAVVHAWGTERGAGLIAARLGYPSLLTMQGIMKWYGEVVPLHAYEKMVAILEGFTLKRAQDVTTESKFGVGYLRERYPRLSVHQVEHAPNWLFHRVIRKPRVSPLRLVCIGTLEYRKGTDVLLQALDQVVREASFELVLIGGGPTTPYMLDLKRTISLGLWNRIQFQTGVDGGGSGKGAGAGNDAGVPDAGGHEPERGEGSGRGGCAGSGEQGGRDSRLHIPGQERGALCAGGCGGVRGGVAGGIRGSGVQARDGGCGDVEGSAGVFVTGADGRTIQRTVPGVGIAAAKRKVAWVRVAC